MSGQLLDAETSETVAGVVRLLGRAAELVWVAIDTDTAGSPRQLLALSIDLAADEVRNLLPDVIPIDGPAPVGAEPTALLRSAEELPERVATGEAATGPNGLCDRSRDGDFRLRLRSNPTRQRKEHDHRTANGHRRRADRHAHG